MTHPTPPRGLPVNPGWYAVAPQAMVVLCHASNGEVCPSAMLAEHVGAHAVFIRRILAQLTRAGLVEAREGRVGGYQLARPAAAIALGDIYRALQSGLPEAMPAPERGPALEPRVRHTLAVIYGQTEQFLIATLDTHTLAEIAEAPLTEPTDGATWSHCQSALDKTTD